MTKENVITTTTDTEIKHTISKPSLWAAITHPKEEKCGYCE